ncbi:MAG: glucosyltransferase domain-containing protein [Lachnospiraceae bacterium]|nr:glucosyltransferase domain-containing protein [Lachnospiraceae bacterium]
MKSDIFFPRIELKQKWAFAACVLTMLLTHLYMFTNKLPNHDDVNRLLVGDTDEVKIQHGRWAGVIFDRISGSSVSIPYVMGVISMLAFAGTAVVLVSLFRVEHKLSIALLCGLLCTFPVSANIFLYGYIADAYFISMFLAAWGVWLLTQERILLNVCGMVLLTLSCGCYQAFWCMGIALLFLYYFIGLLGVKDGWKVYAVRVAKCLGWTAASLILYLIVNKIVQTATGYGATDYQGLSAMGQFGGVRDFIKIVVYAYYEFVQFFYLKGGFTGSHLLIAVNAILTMFVIFMVIRRAKEHKRSVWYWVVLVLFAGLIPMAFNLISVVSMNQTHVLMQYTFLMPYIMCLVLADEKMKTRKLREGSVIGNKMIQSVAYALLFFVAYTGFLTDNAIYFRQQLNYEATYSYTIRLLSRIETMDGYEPSIPVAFINENPQYNDHITILAENYPEDMEYFGFLDGMAGTEPHTFIKRANDIADFCKYYHGYDLKLYEMTKLSELAETKEFREMPTYPQDGGMRYIDGVLVIKLADAE